MAEDVEEQIVAEFTGDQVVANPSSVVEQFYEKGRYGEPKQKKYYYTFEEALYLLERGKMEIRKGKKVLSFDAFFRAAQKTNKSFGVRYAAFKDMRNRGYIVKTALKFGADFRVYDRGVKPGEDHAKWVMYPVSEQKMLTWYEFSAKNRVAHSTRKRLLVACVDAECDVTYWEIKWTRP